MVRSVFFFFYMILAIQLNAIARQVISGWQCKVTPAPNYSLTKDQSQIASLSDGKYTTGNSFWKDPGTLGWQNTGRITFDITLPQALPVTGINLNTVTGQKAQVTLPMSILAFVSNDQQSWSFAGDMMAQSSARDEYYRIVPLTLRNIGITGKYIRLVVVPNGSYFFTDEIQVLTGKQTAAKKPVIVASSAMENFVKEQRTATINKRFSAESESVAAPVARSMAAVGPAGGNGITLTLLASGLSAPGQAANGDAIINTMPGFSEYAAFSLINHTTAATGVKLTFTASTPAVRYQVYWAKPVKSRDFKIVPDALMEVQSGETMNLGKNESRLLFVKAIALQSGTGKFTLTAGDARGQLTVNVGSGSLSSYKQFKPDVNVWPYFNDPFFKGREESARQDLLAHYVNTFLFHPGILQAGVELVKNDRLRANLAYVKGFTNVLLFLDFSAKKDGFLSDTWKQSFLAWYDAMVAALQQQGIAASNIYLYPFDEIKPGQLPVYKQFATWIKSVRKNARLFATVSNATVLNGLAGDVDIFQLYDNGNVLRAYRQQRIPAQQVWLYDTKKPTKSLSPYAYYRLMAWKAFADDVTGIGFWQYADAGHEQNATSLWDDFDGKSADFAVVYDNGSQVLSSRRWEAFKMGVEDYMLLKAYAEKKGKAAAMKICNQVLNDPGNPQTGDQARTQLIKALE
ncbi:glycoside hydrolase domain-containing protein [Chitinophaga polysaccharea]|uniref:glycoside hydrolase domain-containing protein n=1 Tax=Chitinophaga polysaccharea TaxID=1293035 RepID=UPI0011574507|nr:glycoside hydrolase domain-containing protein [Chitinophaga polysaccharea]